MTTALVTGGTSGIGAAFARALAARGDDLVLVARDATRLAEMASELTNAHAIEVEVMSADLADSDDVLRVAGRLASTEQPIDLLVSNAGFGLTHALTAADMRPHEHAIDVMIRAVLILGGAAGRAMKARGHGTIINVSSTATFVTMGGYSAIKSWVTVYTEGLANELRGTGVQVTALCPGWVRTEFHQRADIRTSAIPKHLWLQADRVVAECLDDVAKHKVISIPSKRYRALIFIARHLPRSAIRAVSVKLSSGRH
ncbi:MAG: SDR family NAD(P)-dependent oxidoreductase [Microlunatus sp.]|nr:SDR family NAD(P)-dependent oxidoreductase [Microlunatus sp.]MDN5769996.1 SDR family NAD(P)-dependent oxidoreductase [Microlunatus sp.]MDN5805279.1 SDR family NAD(P)-dependent oxidoreductase [Microlunatus sp.]